MSLQPADRRAPSRRPFFFGRTAAPHPHLSALEDALTGDHHPAAHPRNR
jgi:hypothetical protein